MFRAYSSLNDLLVREFRQYLPEKTQFFLLLFKFFFFFFFKSEFPKRVEI